MTYLTPDNNINNLANQGSFLPRSCKIKFGRFWKNGILVKLWRKKDTLLYLISNHYFLKVKNVLQ